METIKKKKKGEEKKATFDQRKANIWLQKNALSKIFFSPVSGLIFVSSIKIIIMGCACETDNYL